MKAMKLSPHLKTICGAVPGCGMNMEKNVILTRLPKAGSFPAIKTETLSLTAENIRG